MKVLFVVLWAFVLVACNTPSPEFRGVEPVRILVGKSTFDVRVKSLRAEAIRINSEWAPRSDEVFGRATEAIEAVSGCRVRKIVGDQALMIARLSCGG